MDSLPGSKSHGDTSEEPFERFPADIPLPEPVYLLNDLFRQAGRSLFVVGGARPGLPVPPFS